MADSSGSVPSVADLPTKPEKVSLAYRPDVDGLRGVAVLAVVGYHAFPNWVPGGFVGVDVFFVISGYLISTLIFVGLQKNSFSLLDFYGRRIRRIFPALILVLGCCYAFGWKSLLAEEFGALSKHIVGGAGFISNFVLLGESGYFDYGAELKPLLHLWSLGIEEQFYIVWPLLLVTLWRYKYVVPLACAGLMLASFSFNIYELPRDPVSTFYLPWARCWELLAGAVLAWAQLQQGPVRALVRQFEGNATASLLGCASVLAAVCVLNKHSPFPGVWALLPVLGTCAIIASGTATWVNRRILSHRVLVWFGLISFPLYLWHWPILSFAHISEALPLSRTFRILAMVAAVALAWATYRLVELPLRFGRFRNLKAIGLLVGMLIVGLVSYVTFQSEGIPARLPQHMQIEPAPPAAECGDGFPSKATCWGADFGSQRQVLLIGDSHGVALAPGLAAELQESGMKASLVSVGSGGCLPLFNVRSFDASGRKRDCEATFSEAYRYARESESVIAVVLVGRWASRVGSARGFKEKEGDEARGSYEYIGSGSPSTGNSDAFRRGLISSFSMLPASKPVVFVHQVPELGLDPKKCADRPLRFLGNDPARVCTVDLREVVQRQAPYRAIVADALLAYPAVKAFDPTDTLCVGGKCSAVTAGRTVYRDDDHLNGNGAVQVAEELIPHLRSNATGAPSTGPERRVR